MVNALVSMKANSLEKNKKEKEEATTYATGRPGWFSDGNNIQTDAFDKGDIPPPPGHGGNNIQTDSDDEGDMPPPKIGDIIRPRR